MKKLILFILLYSATIVSATQMTFTSSCAVKGLSCDDWETISTFLSGYDDGLLGIVTTSSSVMTDNAIVRGDAGVRGTQESGWLIDDNNNMSISVAYGGLLGTSVTNSYADPIVVAGAVHRVTNDLGYWGLIGMTSSASTIGSSAFVNTFHMYNQGYADTLLTVDGNKDFVFYSDPTDQHNFTALSNEIMRLKANGDLVFTVAGGGLSYAQIYEEDGTSTLDLPAQDTYYQITAFSVNGESNNATPDHTNDHITILVAGKYIVTAQLAISSAQANEYDVHVQKNNGATNFNSTSIHLDTNVANKTIQAAASGVLDLSANDTVELWVKRLDGAAVTKTITIVNVSITLTQVGG